MNYEYKTTFWMDFSIADRFGISAIKDTFDRAFEDWKNNYEYLTELVMVLNHKIWQWYDKNDNVAKLYNELWLKAQQYGYDTLEGDELDYFWRTLD